MSDPNRPAASALDAIIPTHPLAALSYWIGIGSVVMRVPDVLFGSITRSCLIDWV